MRRWGGGVRRALRALREDLWTARAAPLPPSLWLRWLPHGVVCLIAVGVLAGAMGQLHDAGGVPPAYALPVAFGQSGAVVLALWRPVPAWWLSTTAAVLGAVAVDAVGRDHGFPWPWGAAGLIAQLLVLLLLALRVRTRAAVTALCLTVLVTWVLYGHAGPSREQPSSAPPVMYAVAVLVGAALRGRREARAELGRQTTLTAEERARRTLLEERNRIARELHDVVAHHMSVISIQAQVAAHLARDPSEELTENLAGIRGNALEALAELRRVLGVLRSADPDDPYGLGESGARAAPRTPQPTLGRLDALVENTRAAGLAVTLDVRDVRDVGDVRSGPRPYPPGVELSAYRIVQEALSNALRHAPGSTVRVALAHGADGLELSVVNSPPLHPASPSPGVGHGLLGMRERAAMLGGHVVAAGTEEGGFAVSAFLPRDGTVPADPSAPAVPGVPAPGGPATGERAAEEPTAEEPVTAKPGTGEDET